LKKNNNKIYYKIYQLELLPSPEPSPPDPSPPEPSGSWGSAWASWHKSPGRHHHEAHLASPDFQPASMPLQLPRLMRQN